MKRFAYPMTQIGKLGVSVFASFVFFAAVGHAQTDAPGSGSEKTVIDNAEKSMKNSVEDTAKGTNLTKGPDISSYRDVPETLEKLKRQELVLRQYHNLAKRLTAIRNQLSEYNEIKMDPDQGRSSSRGSQNLTREDVKQIVKDVAGPLIRKTQARQSSGQQKGAPSQGSNGVSTGAGRASANGMPKVLTVAGSGEKLTATVQIPDEGNVTVREGAVLPSGLKIVEIRHDGTVKVKRPGNAGTATLGFVQASSPDFEGNVANEGQMPRSRRTGQGRGRSAMPAPPGNGSRRSGPQSVTPQGASGLPSGPTGNQPAGPQSPSGGSQKTGRSAR